MDCFVQSLNMIIGTRTKEKDRWILSLFSLLICLQHNGNIKCIIRLHFQHNMLAASTRPPSTLAPAAVMFPQTASLILFVPSQCLLSLSTLLHCFTVSLATGLLPPCCFLLPRLLVSYLMPSQLDFLIPGRSR